MSEATVAAANFHDTAAAAVAVTLLAGCATGYQGSSNALIGTSTFGYREVKGPGELIKVSFHGNLLTENEAVGRYLVYRCAEIAQREIYDWCREGVMDGRHVVRLKIGDPFVFGRGGEEVLEFRNGLGIEPTVRHADYIGGWLEVLREDNRAIFRAASQASKAAHYLLDFLPAEGGEHD